MEKILLIILFLSGYYFIYLRFKKEQKISKEEDLKESLMTPTQKTEITTKQDQKHRIFIYLALAGIFIMLFLKNTFVGYYIGFGCIVLMGKNSAELGIRWTKKQPWDKKIMVTSFLLLLVALVLIATLYYPQLQITYQDRVK